MFSELHDFDIFPMVFLTGRSQRITVRSLGARGLTFEPSHDYLVRMLEVERAEDSRFAGSGAATDIAVTSDASGTLRFDFTAERESMYFVDVFNGPGRITRLRVYALAHDMAGRYPFRGDLHMHTCRSDGHNFPGTVAADYRSNGYDFTVISDHERYYPSLEVRKLLGIGLDDKSDLTDYLVVPGEEVHLPLNDVHYVNFGGRFSINALLTPTRNTEAGDGDGYRCLYGDCPATMTREAFCDMIRVKAEAYKDDLPIESERLSFAVAEWIYEQQKAAGGLGIFPHPYWLCSTMQLSESYTRYFYEHHPFDAFEVLGGENYYQHNGFQTAFYYEMKAKGIEYPVVGSTDSHNCTENNRNALICSTVVFARENTTADLCASIKDYYSVAVDTISAEYRLVGDFRLIKYGSFLMENWYPLHDAACRAEGYWLGRYVLGEEKAESVLKAMKGQIPGMMKKYFAME